MDVDGQTESSCSAEDSDQGLHTKVADILMEEGQKVSGEDRLLINFTASIKSWNFRLCFAFFFSSHKSLFESLSGSPTIQSPGQFERPATSSYPQSSASSSLKSTASAPVTSNTVSSLSFARFPGLQSRSQTSGRRRRASGLPALAWQLKR